MLVANADCGESMSARKQSKNTFSQPMYRIFLSGPNWVLVTVKLSAKGDQSKRPRICQQCKTRDEGIYEML